MEYFALKNGKYRSRKIPGMPGASPAIKIILALFPMIILAVIYTVSSDSEPGLPVVLPFALMSGIFLVSTLLFSKVGSGSGIEVDQAAGTISFRRPGTQRITSRLSDIGKIVLHRQEPDYATGSNPRKPRWTLLYLRTKDDRRLPMLFGRKEEQIRRVADELSIITSLSVEERSGPFSDISTV